jgi:hypothetical protein
MVYQNTIVVVVLGQFLYYRSYYYFFSLFHIFIFATIYFLAVCLFIIREVSPTMILFQHF